MDVSDSPRSRWSDRFIVLCILFATVLIPALGLFVGIFLALAIGFNWFRFYDTLRTSLPALGHRHLMWIALVILVFVWQGRVVGQTSTDKAAETVQTAQATPTVQAKAQLAVAAPTATVTAKPVPSATAPAPPTPTLTVDAILTQLARSQFRDKLKQARLETMNLTEWTRLLAGTPVPENAPAQPNDEMQTFATVDYDVGVQWDENSTVRSVASELVKLAPGMFAISTVDVLELRAFTEFTDIYGKSKTDVALKFTVSRATAQKVNWPAFDRKNLGIILSGKGDGIYVHPALRKAWNEFTAR